MRARYIGDPRHGGEGPERVRLYGVDFPKGEWVEPVPAALQGKLPGNNHFETDKADLVTVRPVDGLVVLGEKTTEVRDLSAEGAEPHPFAAFDPDGDGRPGGSTASPEKDDLIAELEALGATFDRRWGVARLKAAIEVFKFERGED